ncbi:MAG: hypothetical protein EOP02_20115 [Proteobacteria bacterium]|nr:MAG: hypothetical protein EOP02_20115 [Pseudomonadota bacterium]
MSRDLLVQLCGVHSFALALFHLAFWKLFDWKHELKRVALPTRAITQILNLRLTYLFAGISIACFAFTHDLHATPLGRAVLGFMSVFWVGRTVEQFVFLRLNRPAIHLLTAVFVLGAVLFALPLLSR